MAPAPLSELLPALHGFPRLKHLTLRGHKEEGFALPTAVLQHLPALESLIVGHIGSLSLLSERLPRLTFLEVGYAHRLELGAGAALPSLRSLDSDGVETVVLRCSLPQLTWLCVRGEVSARDAGEPARAANVSR